MKKKKDSNYNLTTQHNLCEPWDANPDHNLTTQHNLCDSCGVNPDHMSLFQGLIFYPLATIF